MSETTNPRDGIVWDWPLRAFHWLLVLSIIALYVTGKMGGNWMEWHQRVGYFALGLMMFRLLWGFAGGHHARFVNFVRGPRAVLRYLKGTAAHSTGHNPLGALSVLAMLAVVSFQAVTGLFANDDILLEGPYASLVAKETSDLLTKLHHWNSNVILGLVGLHIAAILFYTLVRKQNLVGPMWSGRQPGVSETHLPVSNTRAVVLMVLVAALTWMIVTKAWK
jgi:cytochrome b